MEVESFSNGEKEKFRQVANKLLNQIFILRKKEDTKNDYYYIRDKKNFPAFKEFFSYLGYEITVNEDFGVVALESSFGTNRLGLNKINSILLLIFRLLYIEKKKDLTLSGDEVVVNMEEVRSKIRMFEVNNKKLLPKGIEKESIQLFKRYNLIKTLDVDITDAGGRLLIYPSILFALTNKDLNVVYDATQQKLNEYNQGQEDEQEDID